MDVQATLTYKVLKSQLTDERKCLSLSVAAYISSVFTFVLVYSFFGQFLLRGGFEAKLKSVLSIFHF